VTVESKKHNIQPAASTKVNLTERPYMSASGKVRAQESDRRGTIGTKPDSTVTCEGGDDPRSRRTHA